MSRQKYDYLFKIKIYSEFDEQKTEFLSKFFDESCTQNHLNSIGTDFRTKVINYENKLIKLQLFNSAGQFRFHTITKSDYKGANGVILMYDVTDLNSFKNMRNLMKQMDAYADKSTKKILVGNKCDSPDRVVTEEEGKKLAEEYSFGFLETTTTTNKNINEVFYYLLKDNPKIKQVEQINHNSKKCIII